MKTEDEKIISDTAEYIDMPLNDEQIEEVLFRLKRATLLGGIVTDNDIENEIAEVFDNQ